MDITKTTVIAATKPHSKYQSALQWARTTLHPIAFFIYTGAQIMDVMSLTGVLLSTSAIAERYNVNESTASWVLSAYSLTFGSFMLLFGRLGDVTGHRSMFIGGMVFFAVCSAVAAGVNNLVVLIVFRALQGMGAAATVPTSFALIAITFEGPRQQLAIALVGTASAFGAVIGILVGGAFATTDIGFKGLLWMLCGLAALFALLSYIVIPPTPSNWNKFRKIDYYGTVMIVGGALLVVLGFTESPANGWRSAIVIAPIVVGVLLLISFFLFENYVAGPKLHLEPLIPNEIWSYHNYWQVFVISPFIFAAVFAMLLIGVEFLVVYRGTSYILTAVQMLPLAIAAGCLAVVGGLIYGKISPKIELIAGIVILFVPMVLWAQADNVSSYWRFIFPAQIVAALGAALYYTTFLNMAATGSPLHMQGLVQGSIQTVSQIGTAIGFSVATIEIGDPTQLDGYHRAFYTLLGYLGAGLIIGVIFLKGVKKAAPVEADTEAKRPDPESVDF